MGFSGINFGFGGSGGSGTIKSLVAGRNISINSTDPANPIISTSADHITVVANYSALPNPTTVPTQFYWCEASQGTAWLPGSLGGTYYSAGLYYSNGTIWEFLATPYQATQAQVDAGTLTDVFVSPNTFANASKWGTILNNTALTGVTTAQELRVGNMGTEGGGITINGIAFTSSFKVSDIDGTNYAQTILHRHSTTLEPVIVGARSNSDTSSHADVTAGMNVMTIYGAGWLGTNYKLFGQISFQADTTGVLSNTSSSGALVFYTTPTGTIWPTATLSLRQDKSVQFAGTITAGTWQGTAIADSYISSASTWNAKYTLSGATGDLFAFSGANTQGNIIAVATGYLLGSQGVGTLPAWLQAATLNTSLTTPLLIGGTGTTSSLTFQTTTGVATTGADFIWKGGTNGGTTLAKLTNAGNFGIGMSPINILDITLNQSNPSTISLLNNSSGNVSMSRLLLDNGTTAGGIAHYGTGFSGTGVTAANQTTIYGNGANGISFNAYNANGFFKFGTGTSYTERWRIATGGNLSNTGADGTAYIHIKAGTSTAGTAQLKLDSSTLLATPEAGAIENNGTNLFYTPSSTRLGIVLDNGTRLTSGRIPIATTSGYLNDTASLRWVTNDGLYITGAQNQTNLVLYPTNNASNGQAAIALFNSDGQASPTGYLLSMYGDKSYTLGVNQFFGLDQRNRAFIVSNGANNNGIGLGTLSNQALYLGTNNTLRGTLSGAGLFTWASTYHVLSAGTATAGQSPLKYTSGVLLTVAEAGANEYDGTNFYNTNSTGVRGTILENRQLSSSASTLSLTNTYTRYIYTGSTNTTWTMFALSGNSGKLITIHNRGTGNIILNSSAGASDFSDLGTPVTQKIILVGENYSFYNDGTYFIVH